MVFRVFPAAWPIGCEISRRPTRRSQCFRNCWMCEAQWLGFNMGWTWMNNMGWTGGTTPTKLDFNHVWYGLASNNTISNHWGRYAKSYGMWNSLSWGSFLIATAVRGFIGCVQVTGAGQWSIFAILQSVHDQLNIIWLYNITVYNHIYIYIYKLTTAGASSWC